MRWQRPTFKALQRWADLTQGIQLRGLADFVVPTVSLGHDFTDAERPVFMKQQQVAAGAGNSPHLTLMPVVGDVEIIAVWASRNGGPLNLGVTFQPPTLTNSDQWLPSATGALCNAFVRLAALPVSLAPHFESPSDTTLVLPFAGVVVGVGREFQIGGATGGQTLSLGILVRNVGGSAA